MAETAELERLLEERYPAPEYALFWNVANGVGMKEYRYADALAMSLFPSRGLYLDGFEIKVSRSDWLRELKRPQKADPIAGYCDHWWVIVPSLDIVQDEELPKPWGLMFPDAGGGLRIRKKAEQLEPKLLDRKFLAALLRRAHERMTGHPAIRQAEERAYERAQKESKLNRSDEMKRLQARVLEYEKMMREFKSKAGLDIHEYNAGQLGAAVKMVMYCQQGHAYQQLERLATFARHMQEEAEEFMKALKQEEAAEAAKEVEVK